MPALATDSADATIVQIAHALSLATVGEGVETVEQMQLLASYGCCRMQGYRFSEGVESERIARLPGAPPFWWMRGRR